MGLKSGTSWSNPVVIKGAPGHRPRFTNYLDINRSGGGAIQFIRFENFIIDGAGLSILGEDPHDLQFDNIEVKNAPDSGVSVYPEGSSGIGGERIEFSNMDVHNNGDSVGDHGFYSCAKNMVIRDSKIYDNSYYGLQIYWTGVTNGDSNLQACNTGVVIKNNRIYNNRGGQGAVTLNHTKNLLFYNNLVYNNAGGAIHAISIGARENIKIYNNTFYGNGNSDMDIVSGAINTEVKNNIFANNSFVGVNNGTGTAIEKNLCSNTSTPYCTHSGNPNFTNPGAAGTAADFSLQPGSAAINQGATLASVPDDFLHRTRNAPYDMGAYEAGAGGSGRVSPLTFYVSTGGVDPPSRTCTAATDPLTPLLTLDAGRACLIVAGDKLFLRGGSYTGSIYTPTQPVASGSNWTVATTIAAFGTETVTILLPAAEDVVLYFNASDQFIVLDRLILDCQNKTGSNGLAMGSGTHHIRFQNGEVRNCHYEPVYIWTSDNNEILNSIIHGNVTKACINLDFGSNNTIIQGNELHTCAGGGIEASNPNNGTIIRNNRIHDVGTTESQAGIITAGATSPVIINNVVANNYRGIHLQAGTTNDAKVYNNTIHGNATQGLQIEPSAGAVVTNNIVAANSTDQIVNNGTGPTPTTNLTTAPPFDPAFPGRFHLTAAATTAINMGTALPADVPTDYEGVTRPQPVGGQYDIGASEFVGTVVTEPPPPGVAIRQPYWRSQGFFWR